MKIELKIVVNQLNELMDLENGYSVAALTDDTVDKDGGLIGWTIVKKDDEGNITPAIKETFTTLKELYNFKNLNYELFKS